MLVRNIKAIARNKFLALGLAGLLIGQLLYMAGFGALFMVSLIFVLAIGLPYPQVFSSFASRFVMAALLAFGFVQVAATVQFFIFPESDFKTLSALTALLAIGAVVIMHSFVQPERPKFFDSKDAGAALTAAFFALPLALFCFWGNNPERLVVFGGMQSPDGSAHNVAFDEMYGKQHLTYRTNPTYYPKGFHIANSLFMDGFELHKKQNDWLANARIFVAQYIVWGSLLAFSLYYLACQLLGKFVNKLSRSHNLLLALTLGPVIGLFYLIPFANQGFINFYYICAAFAGALLFLPGFKLQTAIHRWFVLAYFLFAFGITMSWGPILLPVVAAIPLLYAASQASSIKDFIKQVFFSKKYLTVFGGFVLLLAPIYFYLTYASENAFNAHGSIRIFNYALLITGLIAIAFIAFTAKVPAYVKNVAVNALLPTFLLVAGLAAAQYFLVGETRYYTIKTSFLLELVLVSVAAALLVYLVLKSNLASMQKWFMAPVLFGGLAFLLISANGNPLEHIRNMASSPDFFESDVKKMTDLAVANELKVSNNAILHYLPAEDKIIGNPLIPNWANGLSPVNDGNPEAAACNSVIFSTFAYGSGSAEEQKNLVQAIKACIADRVDKQQKPYYIITDPASQPHLQRVLGDKPTFL
jgi:hypothetical protein